MQIQLKTVSMSYVNIFQYSSVANVNLYVYR